MARSSIERLNTLRDEVIRWAVAHHEEELFEGMRCFGARPRNEDELRSALAFSLLAPPPGELALAVRFARQAGRRPRAERYWLSVWERTLFSVMCIRDVEPGSWIEVHDVLIGRRLRIPERMGSLQLKPGNWLAAFHYHEGTRWLFEGAIRPLPQAVAVQAVAAAVAALEAISPGLGVRQARPEQTHQLARPVLLAVKKMTNPRFVNADGHDLLMVTATIGLRWGEVLETLRQWPDTEELETSVGIFGVEPVDYMAAPVVRATFTHEEGAVTLFANSRQRVDAVLRRWEEHTGRLLPVVDEEIETIDSDPEGEELMVDSQRIEVPTGADPGEVARGIQAAHQAQWPDIPIPVLGGLTPRQAALVPARVPVLWALLYGQDTTSSSEAAFSNELGLQLPAIERP